MRLILLALLFFVEVFAAPPKAWEVVDGRSALKFSATQNGSKVHGWFENFETVAFFSPSNLKESNIAVTVDLHSIKTDMKNVTDTLKSAEWFDAQNHPKAVFKSRKIEAVSGAEGQFIAEGLLTMKNASMPVTLNFSFKKGDTVAEIAGNAVLNRTDFNVGWDNTGVVANEVLLHFEIFAK